MPDVRGETAETFGEGMLDRAERKTKKRIEYAGVTRDRKRGGTATG